LRHGGDVAQFDQVFGDFEIPVIIVNFILNEFDSPRRPLQPFIRADDPDVIPHAPPDFIPVVGDDDAVVAFGGAAGIPQSDGRGVVVGVLEGFGDLCEDAMRINHGLQQGIAGQPVRAVQSGAGHFAAGEKTGEGGPAVMIDRHAAADVMRRRNNGDGIGRHVDAVLQAALINIGEAVDDEIFFQMRHIQQHVLVAGFFDFRVDGFGHDVPRGQAAHGMIFFHERRSVFQP